MTISALRGLAARRGYRIAKNNHGPYMESYGEWLLIGASTGYRGAIIASGSIEELAGEITARD